MTDLIITIIYFIVAYSITTVALLLAIIILRQGFQNVQYSILSDVSLHDGSAWMWLIILELEFNGALRTEHEMVIDV